MHTYIGIKQYVYEGQLSLVLGSRRKWSGIKTISNSHGKLQVYLNGKWTFVCDESFGYDEAESSCKQLGYTSHSFCYAQLDVYG